MPSIRFDFDHNYYLKLDILIYANVCHKALTKS